PRERATPNASSGRCWRCSRTTPNGDSPSSPKSSDGTKPSRGSRDDLRAGGHYMITMMSRALSLPLVVVAVGAGVWGYLYAQDEGGAPKYRTERAERGPIVAAVSATGNLNAVTTVQVGTQVSGQIRGLYADFNSVVRKGQVIARIDAATFEAKVKQARGDEDSAKANVLNQEAQVERARAEVGNARSALAEGKAQTARAQVAVADTNRDLGRRAELFQRTLIPKSEYDTAQAAYDAAVAMLDAARAKEESLAGAIGSAQAQLRVAEAMLRAARAQVERKEAARSQASLDLEPTLSTARVPRRGRPPAPSGPPKHSPASPKRCCRPPARRWSRRKRRCTRRASISSTPRSTRRSTAWWCRGRWMSGKRSRRVWRRRPSSPSLET